MMLYALKIMTQSRATSIYWWLGLYNWDLQRILYLADAGSERFLVNFTLRDSVTAFVNVTCWGSENYIKDLCAGFCIGDIGKNGRLELSNKDFL